MSVPNSVVIINSGLGNVASIANMLRVLKTQAVMTISPDEIRQARRIVLPGVGAFDAGMTRLHQLGLVEPIIRAAADGIPILGICLGMQLLTLSSEEGSIGGLGLVQGRTVRVPIPTSEAVSCKLPHMGWNNISISRSGGLYAGTMTDPRFYFVHSYHVVPEDHQLVTATTQHGSTTITASIQQRNIFGAQFHPEKSHRYGLWLMSNFLGISPC